MQYKPSLTSQDLSLSNKPHSIHQYNPYHNVLRSNSTSRSPGNAQFAATSKCFLMSIPNESLAHITTFVVDPSSLFALSRVNRRLRALMADDNTWYRAFAFHFLGVGPASESSDEQKLMLRRSETTWKKEYVTRFNLTRRWARSRSVTHNYQPHYWGVSDMHLLDNVSLLTANMQYGIVTRSFPLTGKTLKGYLDASGTTNGLGIGNPNEEFSPNVTCIALSSRGGTGHIAWGFRHGAIAMTSVSRVIESNSSAAHYAKCRVEDEHAGEVRCVAFTGRNDGLLISGCAYGQVKLWDVRHMRCLWTGSGKKEDSVLPNACLKVDINIGAGLLVAALESGDIMVWWGFQAWDDESGGNFSISTIQDLRIVEPSEIYGVETLLLDPNSSPGYASILVRYLGDCHFLRLDINLSSGLATRTRFCTGPLGLLTNVNVCFAVSTQSASAPLGPSVCEGTATSSLKISLVTEQVKYHETSFVLGGDSLGGICVWNWDEAKGVGVEEPYACGAASAQVNPSFRWEAHDDGAICAIEVCGAVIVTGSTRGTLKVWDSLTLSLLRSFSSPCKASVNGEWDPVGRIIVRNDLLVASVGNRILVWQAGNAPLDKARKRNHPGKPKGRATSNALSKWQQQLDFNREVRESQCLLAEERVHFQRAYGRERAQLSALDQLGLDEREAVEYVLMLSRDEDEQRRASEFRFASLSSESGEGDAGMIPFLNEDDMEGIFSLDEPPGLTQIALSTLAPAPDICRTPGALTSIPTGYSRLLPRCIPSRLNVKVQASPSLFPESTKAELTTSSLAHNALHPDGTSPPPIDRHTGLRVSPPGFLLSNSTDAKHSQTLPSMLMPNRSTPSLKLSGSWTKGSPSSDRSLLPSSTASVSSRPTRGSGVTVGETEEDAELKYALELSLAEARSRGGA